MTLDIDQVDLGQAPTAEVLQELQLYGYRPFDDEPDPRPLPEARLVAGAVNDMFDGVLAAFQETRLEYDLEPLLWGIVNLTHRHLDRVERALDDNEQQQKRSQREQDGSEVRSVELERLIREGISLLERRDTFELMRDQAADQYHRHILRPWTPAIGSLVNRAAMTAAVLDSREFIAARRRMEAETMIPAGDRIALTGGYDYQDHAHIWQVLDRVQVKHPHMVLLHGGSPKGAEHIASLWARERKVPQIVFKPDFARHRAAAPFKRNDQLLETMPIGVIVFPGTGIQDNLADKARKLGIPLMDYRSG